MSETPKCATCGAVANRQDIDGAWWPACAHMAAEWRESRSSTPVARPGAGTADEITVGHTRYRCNPHTGVWWQMYGEKWICDVDSPWQQYALDQIAGLRAALASSARGGEREADLENALRNVMGLLDTPVMRRYFGADTFYTEAVVSARQALAVRPAEARRAEERAEDSALLDAISKPGASTRVYKMATENCSDPPMVTMAEARIPHGAHSSLVSQRRSLREAIRAAARLAVPASAGHQEERDHA